VLKLGAVYGLSNLSQDDMDGMAMYIHHCYYPKNAHYAVVTSIQYFMLPVTLHCELNLLSATLCAIIEYYRITARSPTQCSHLLVGVVRFCLSVCLFVCLLTADFKGRCIYKHRKRNELEEYDDLSPFKCAIFLISPQKAKKNCTMQAHFQATPI